MSFNHRRRIFLMRHGSVTYFDSAGKPFLPESVPLNAQGREQATACHSAASGQSASAQATDCHSAASGQSAGRWL